MQEPEGFRVKASEGEVVVLYFEPSATQNLKSSGFPDVLGRSQRRRPKAKTKGETTWQNRPHPSNSPTEVSKNLSFHYDIGNNFGSLSNLCHVVYATKGLSQAKISHLSESVGTAQHAQKVIPPGYEIVFASMHEPRSQPVPTGINNSVIFLGPKDNKTGHLH